MKTIVYLFIISLMAISLTVSAQNNIAGRKILTIQATDKNVTGQLLQQSAKVISDRLKTYGLSSVNVNIMPDKAQVKIELPGDIQTEPVERLLISRGELAFYETLTIKGITDIIKGDQAFGPTDARIGCSTYEDPAMVAKVEDYLRSGNHPARYRLFWGLKNEKSLTCLYALKINDSGKPLMVRSDLETIDAIPEKDSQTYRIEMKFTKPSIEFWAEATKNNLGRQIAIVIDERVYSAPVVKAQINSGLCEITGSLTKQDVNYFLALVNNDPLPLSFKIVR